MYIFFTFCGHLFRVSSSRKILQMDLFFLPLFTVLVCWCLLVCFLFGWICLLLASSGDAPDSSSSAGFPYVLFAHARYISVCQLATDRMFWWLLAGLSLGSTAGSLVESVMYSMCVNMKWCICSGFVWCLCSLVDTRLGTHSDRDSDWMGWVKWTRAHF